jgi:ribosomal protein L11 methyltransferase
MANSPAHRFHIVGPGADNPAAGSVAGVITLVLERGAFGGGTHATTASCLDVLATLAPLKGAVLDLGSGTGILAIAALRLGADRAVCVDINPEAVEIARRNGAANAVTDRMRCVLGDVEDVRGTDFDMVVANIGGELLIDASSAITCAARRGGHLLLSGILRDYSDDLADAYQRSGCRVVERRFADEFCTMLLRRD